MSSALPSPDIYELVSSIDLVGIKFLHISAQAKENPPEDESTVELGMKIQESHGEDTLEVRFRVQVDHSEANYEVELASRYASKDRFEFSEEVLRDFIERVAIMAVFPYIREAISSMAARLELEVPILGMLRQGEFKLGTPKNRNPESAQA